MLFLLIRCLLFKDPRLVEIPLCRFAQGIRDGYDLPVIVTVRLRFWDWHLHFHDPEDMRVRNPDHQGRWVDGRTSDTETQ